MQFNSCLCFSLKTGSLILGYAHIILHSIQILLFSLVYHDVLEWKYMENDDTVFLHLIVVLCISLTVVLFSIMLVYGIHKKKPNYMLPFLITKFLILVLISILAVISSGSIFVALIQNGCNTNFIIGLILIPTVLVLYWMLYYVIYSHYRQLTEGPIHHRFYNNNIKDQSNISIVTKQ